MKPILTLFLFLYAVSFAGAQCNYSELLAKGKTHFSQQRFSEALSFYNAARNCDRSKTEEVDAAVDELFATIELQKENARKNREQAEMLRRQAEAAQAEANREKQRSDSLYAARQQTLFDADNARLRAIVEQKKADSLAGRGALLLSTLVQKDENEGLQQLIHLGYRYFAYNTDQLGRDYAQARIYFALAGFIETNPKIEQMIQCAQLGVQADKLFFEGEIDSAEVRYREIVQLLEAVSEDPVYERKQIADIQEINSLIEKQALEQKVAVADVLVLDGNWWTVPAALFALRPPAAVIIRNNNALTDALPYQLLQQQGIQRLTIENCPRFTGVNSWGALTGLEALHILGNTALQALYLPGRLAGLKTLTVENNANLVRLHSTEPLLQLQALTLKNNPLLSETTILADLPAMKNLDIAGNFSLATTGLPIARMAALERLAVSDIRGLKVFSGAGHYPRLRYLTLRNMPDLVRIENFSNLPVLESMALEGNPALKNLRAFKKIPALKQLAVEKNDRLHSVLKWSTLDSLQSVSITDNARLRRLGNWQALKKVPVKRLGGNNFLHKNLSVQFSFLSDFFSDNSFNAAYSLGLNFYIESPKSFLSFVPSIEYFRFEGLSASDTSKYLPFFRASRTIKNPVSGVEMEQVRYLNGVQRYDFRYLNLKLLGKLNLISTETPMYFLFGPSLMYRFSGRVSAEIDGSGEFFKEELQDKIAPYLFGGIGLFIPIKRFVLFGEFGGNFPIGNTYNDNTIRRTFYSSNATVFNTTPVDNAFIINYKQPAFETFAAITLGVSYQLNYYNPFAK